MKKAPKSQNDSKSAKEQEVLTTIGGVQHKNKQKLMAQSHEHVGCKILAEI